MIKVFLSIIAKILLVIISLVAAFLIVEYTLPLFNIRTIEEAVYQARRPVVQGRYGKYHPVFHYTLQNNLKNVRLHYPEQLDYTVSTNDEGFRGPDWDRSPQRKNIMLLGDSFGFGWGVEWEETVGYLVEKELRKMDRSFQVINLAMSGWDLNTITTCFEYYEEQLNPKAVIYIFCPNDLLCPIEKKPGGGYKIKYNAKPGDAEAFKAMVARQQPDYWSWNKYYRSAYCKAYHARIIRPIFSDRIKKSLSIDPAPDGYDFPPPLDRPQRCTLEEKYKAFLFYCLDRIKAKLGNHPFYIIDTSDKSILYKADAADNRRWLLMEYSEQRPNVHFVDFETIIRQTPGSRRYYLDYDDHWSPEGHQKAAALLLKEMKNHHFSSVHRSE